MFIRSFLTLALIVPSLLKAEGATLSKELVVALKAVEQSSIIVDDKRLNKEAQIICDGKSFSDTVVLLNYLSEQLKDGKKVSILFWCYSKAYVKDDDLGARLIALAKSRGLSLYCWSVQSAPGNDVAVIQVDHGKPTELK